MMKEALNHRDGMALLDILQPCFTFNHQNTFKWYRERVRPVDPAHDPFDREAAFRLAMKFGDEIPVGVIYRSKRKSFESQLEALKDSTLVSRCSTAG